MAETICKRRCASFYLPKDTFDGIPISVCEYMKSVPVFGKDWSEVARIIDEKLGAIELIPSVDLGQKPSRRLFRHRRKRTHVRDLVRLGIDRTVQPKVLSVQADHFLVNRELIRTDRRDRL